MFRHVQSEAIPNSILKAVKIGDKTLRIASNSPMFLSYGISIHVRSYMELNYQLPWLYIIIIAIASY